MIDLQDLRCFNEETVDAGEAVRGYFYVTAGQLDPLNVFKPVLEDLLEHDIETGRCLEGLQSCTVEGVLVLGMDQAWQFLFLFGHETPLPQGLRWTTEQSPNI